MNLNTERIYEASVHMKKRFTVVGIFDSKKDGVGGADPMFLLCKDFES